MPDFIPGSYSRLETYLQCPKKFYYQSVAPKDQRTPYIESVQMRQGKVIHKQVENRVNSKGQEPFAPGYEYLDKWTAPIIASSGHKFTELALTVDRNLVPCGAQDWDNAYLRAIVDVAIIDRPNSFQLDWKSGNPNYSNELQHEVNAALTFHHFPEVETIGAVFAYLKIDSPSKVYNYTRQDLPGLWEKILTPMEQIQVANRVGDWPAQRNKFCAWCAVNRLGKCEEARRWGIEPRA